MTSFSTLLSVHLISIALSVGLLTLRFWLRYQKQARIIAFPLALVVLYIIIKLATTKVPLLG